MCRLLKPGCPATDINFYWDHYTATPNTKPSKAPFQCTHNTDMNPSDPDIIPIQNECNSITDKVLCIDNLNCQYVTYVLQNYGYYCTDFSYKTGQKIIVKSIQECNDICVHSSLCFEFSFVPSTLECW